MTVKKENKTGLGRGLSALLGDFPDSTVVPQNSPSRVSAGSISKIPLDAIETNPWQPRNTFESEALAELADSIKLQGLIQPIAVRDMGNGKYQLISGERRVRASRLAGMTMITAYVRTANDMQMMEMALAENIHRADLNPIEIALSLKRMQEECQVTQEDLADRVGKSRSAVTNYMRLLKLATPVQVALCNHSLSMGHARALVVLEDAELQQKMLDKILSQGLSVRQVEDKVREMLQSAEEKTEVKQVVKVELPQHYKEASRQLATFLQAPVDIQRDLRGRGKVTIKFKSDEEFQRILALLQE